MRASADRRSEPLLPQSWVVKISMKTSGARFARRFLGGLLRVTIAPAVLVAGLALSAWGSDSPSGWWVGPNSSVWSGVVTVVHLTNGSGTLDSCYYGGIEPVKNMVMMESLTEGYSVLQGLKLLTFSTHRSWSPKVSLVNQGTGIYFYNVAGNISRYYPATSAKAYALFSKYCGG